MNIDGQPEAVEEKNTIRLLVADDHPVVREGLTLLLGRRANLEVVAQAANGLEAVAAYEQHRPDVAIIDVQMPTMNGAAATEAIIKAHPQANILLLTTLDDDEDVFRGLRAGARGYLVKDAPTAELVEAIQTIRGGARYLSSRTGGQSPKLSSCDCLTHRERQVLWKVTEGKSNKEIASLLGIAEGTIKSHLSSVMGKLGVKTRTEAALAARARGFRWD